MVFFFKSRCGEYTIYMGKDKFENEDLIKYGWNEDIWFHVDSLSSAHVYCRLKPGQTLSTIPDELILDCSTLVKANSIAGCKLKTAPVVYTRWKNLKKTAGMVEGQVTYHRPENVKRIEVEKNNPLVKQLEKTKEEKFPDLWQLQQDRLREVIEDNKERRRFEEKQKKKEALENKKRKEELSYDRILNEDNMVNSADVEGTADASAAEAYEDDFF
eukprot:CAMPEP_0119010888 /NCGR_PEP_ID=MMETSP1176-20130426/5315_1 /TAXON_ID=265551 /ORGANISM="Synedropsis recta cf, Strain CCMP1620" /LENGTH=214 /DNA_ID=CAMNT_0006963629 /DNA_START=71 /DNA_END=715 /DNA_ORIENTATION=-